jgi:hypothetical protein
MKDFSNNLEYDLDWWHFFYAVTSLKYPNPHNYFYSGVQLIQVKSSTEGQQLKTQKLRTSSPTGKPRHKFVFLFFITMKNF